MYRIIKMSDCKGCVEYSNIIGDKIPLTCIIYMREEEYGKVYPRCPCMTCLVKVTCTKFCEEYTNISKIIRNNNYTRIK